jgi:hypothetical protein
MPYLDRTKGNEDFRYQLTVTLAMNAYLSANVITRSHFFTGERPSAFDNYEVFKFKNKALVN